MDFGLVMAIRNPRQFHRPDHDVYQAYIEGAVLAEKLGFDHVWCSEHHFTEDGWSPAQLPVLAAIAARTERIRLGTYVLLLPLHNPVRAAEDAATVDIISNGRLDLAVGPGANPDEFASFGVPFRQRRSRMYEGLEIIRRCFDEECFSFKGKYYEFNDVRMTTRPVQKRLPLWVAAMGEKAVAEAGAAGYHLAAAPGARKLQIYDEALRGSGRNPKDFQRAGLHFGHVAETREQAWDEAEAHLHFHMTWHFKMVARQRAHGGGFHDPGYADLSVPPLGELRKTGRGPYGPALVGAPKDIIRMLEDELKTNPMTEVVISMGLPGMNPRQARRSMELFAREVIPHFRG